MVERGGDTGGKALHTHTHVVHGNMHDSPYKPTAKK
jgi:hypothetical protein